MALNFASLIPGLLNAGLGAYNANQAADAATAAGQQAAQAAQFRPVGITTRFGRTGFQYSPEGRLIGAGYQVAPDVAAMRESLLGLAGRGLQQGFDAAAVQPAINQAGVGLFNLGRGYLAETPEQAAEQFMTQQRALLAPGREQQLAQLTNQQFQRGRLGLATGATQQGFAANAPGLAASNPQFAAYYNALAQEDARLAAAARQAGMEQARFGQGLLGGALNIIGGGFGLQQRALEPFQTSFGLAQAVEEAGGKVPLGMSTTLGAGSPAAAQALLSSGMSANDLREARNAQFAGALRDPISALIGGLTNPNAVGGFNALGFGSGLGYGNQDLGLFL